MAEFNSYRAGTPSWIDVAPSDAAAARAFYGDLFGWEFEVGPDETGNYANAKVRGKRVAGMLGQPQEGVPVVWTTYFATDDADATAAKITEAGGSLMMEPMDVMDLGRMAVAFDSTGAPFGLWQAGTHKGAEIANEPVSLVWSDLVTADVDAACDFYGKVFGYHYAADGSEDNYRMFSVDPDPGFGEGQGYVLGGITGFPAGDVPAHWRVHLAVANADETAAKASELGGEVVDPLRDSPYGRQAGIRDPQGATFNVIGYSG